LKDNESGCNRFDGDFSPSRIMHIARIRSIGRFELSNPGRRLICPL
jgi:hypothetical protein